MAHWNKEAFRLKKNHGWKAKPGYKIFVADGGAIRFDFPGEWVVVPGAMSTKFYDRQPPDDKCTLEVSLIRLPPVDWSGLPLARLIQEVLKDDYRDTTGAEEIHTVRRPDLELAWTEGSFIDPHEGREARSRVCLARGSNIHALMTLDFWTEDTARLGPVWEELIRSLELAVSIKDPRRGVVPM